MSIASLIAALDERGLLHILRKTCKLRHVTLEEMLEGGRSRAVVRAREDCIMILLDAGLSHIPTAKLLNLEQSTISDARKRHLARTATTQRDPVR